MLLRLAILGGLLLSGCGEKTSSEAPPTYSSPAGEWLVRFTGAEASVELLKSDDQWLGELEIAERAIPLQGESTPADDRAIEVVMFAQDEWLLADAFGLTYANAATSSAERLAMAHASERYVLRFAFDAGFAAATGSITSNYDETAAPLELSR